MKALLFPSVCLLLLAGAEAKPKVEKFSKSSPAGRTLTFTPVHDVKIRDTAVFDAAWNEYGFEAAGADTLFSRLFAIAFRHYAEKGSFRYDSAATAADFLDTTFTVWRDSVPAPMFEKSPEVRAGQTPRDTAVQVAESLPARVRKPLKGAATDSGDVSITLIDLVFGDEKDPLMKRFFTSMARANRNAASEAPLAPGAASFAKPYFGPTCMSDTRVVGSATYVIWDHRAGKAVDYGRLTVNSGDCGKAGLEKWRSVVNSLALALVTQTPFTGEKANVRSPLYRGNYLWDRYFKGRRRSVK